MSRVTLRRKKSVIGLPQPEPELVSELQEEAPKLPEPIVESKTKLPNSVQSEPSAVDFSKYLRKSNVRGRNEGVTSRVDKILSFLHLKSEVPEGVDLSAEESWRIEKRELEDKIELLKKELVALRDTGIVERVYVEVGRPGLGDGVLEELEILRADNFELRNAQGKTANKLVAQLKGEVAELQSRNEELRNQLMARRDEVYLARPPKLLQRVPLELEKSQRERVLQVLENEWKEACEISRHAKADPIKNPFERRRFNPPDFPIPN